MPHFLKKKKSFQGFVRLPLTRSIPLLLPQAKLRCRKEVAFYSPFLSSLCISMCSSRFFPLLGGKGEIPGGTCPHSHPSPFSSLHTPNFARKRNLLLFFHAFLLNEMLLSRAKLVLFSA